MGGRPADDGPPAVADDVRALLGSGCSLIFALVDPDGEPFATRAWAADVDDGSPAQVRTILGAADLDRLDPPPPATGGWAFALTGADVRTLRAAQVKGTVERLEPVSPADARRAAAHYERFMDAVVAVDGVSRDLLEHMVPADLVACVGSVAEVYDQSPGPTAGARVP